MHVYNIIISQYKLGLYTINYIEALYILEQGPSHEYDHKG